MKPAARGGATEPALEREAASSKSMSDDRAALGPMPCINCGSQVIWVRLDGRWRLMQGGVHHECPMRKAA